MTLEAMTAVCGRNQACRRRGARRRNLTSVSKGRLQYLYFQRQHIRCERGGKGKSEKRKAKTQERQTTRLRSPQIGTADFVIPSSWLPISESSSFHCSHSWKVAAVVVVVEGSIDSEGAIVEYGRWWAVTGSLG